VVGEEASACAFRFRVAAARDGVVLATEPGVVVGVEEDGPDVCDGAC